MPVAAADAAAAAMDSGGDGNASAACSCEREGGGSLMCIVAANSAIFAYSSPAAAPANSDALGGSWLSSSGEELPECDMDGVGGDTDAEAGADDGAGGRTAEADGTEIGRASCRERVL